MEATFKIIDRPFLIEMDGLEEPLMVYCGELKEWEYDESTSRVTIEGAFKTFKFTFIENKENSLEKLKSYLNGESEDQSYFSIVQTYQKSDIEFSYDQYQLVAVLKALKDMGIHRKFINIGYDEKKLLRGDIDIIKENYLDINIQCDFLFGVRMCNERRRKIEELRK